MSDTEFKLTNYFKRTLEHIHRVQKNMLSLVTTHRDRLKLSPNECRHLMYNVMNHDRSKFSIQQFAAYIELTEYYRQRKVLGNKDYDYAEGDRVYVDAAINDHYKVENHHPEMFEKGSLGKWGRENAIECACDLQAMAQEFDEGSCRGYWENVWLKKHYTRFYDDYNWQQIQDWMREAIECLEGDLNNHPK